MTRPLVLQLGALLATYAGARALTVVGLLPAVVRWHLADLLCLPLVLGAALGLQRLWRGDPTYRLPRWHGLSAWVLYTVYFEGILPHLSPTATADAMDGVWYLAGWGLFEVWLNRVRPGSRRPEPA